MFNWFDAPFWCMIGAALVLMVLQLGGGHHGASDSHHIDIHHTGSPDPHTDTPDDLVGLAKAGQVPLSIWLLSFFFGTGLVGLMANQVILGIGGGYPTWFFPVALALAGLGGSLSSRVLSRLMGRLFQETTAATAPEELIGSVGTVISAEIPTDSHQPHFGRARLYTSQGVQLQIACVTEPGCALPQKDQPIFITGYHADRNVYTVLVHESPDYYGYLQGSGKPHVPEANRLDTAD